MKYLRLFNNHEEYLEYIASEEFVVPSVQACKLEQEAHFNDVQPEPPVKNYFKFIAGENATFSFTNSIEYSLDSGETWTALAANESSPSLSEGDEIWWKREPTRGGERSIGTFSATGNFDAAGNALSIVYGSDFEYAYSIEGKDGIFKELFKNNTHIINAEDMILTADTLSNACYDSMFLGCSNLVTAPELPATNLTPYCYRSMFEECTSLRAMPTIGMLSVDEGSCQYMFYDCSSMTSVVEKLEPLTLEINCYDSMFEKCSSITGSPELPALELVSQCYNHMFYDCSNLAFIKAAFVTTPSSNYTHEWVGGSNDTFGVAPVGQFFKGIDAEWEDEVSVNAIPSGWTVLSFESVYFSFTNKDTTAPIEISFAKATPADTLYWSRDFGQTWNEYTETIVSSTYNENIVFKGELTVNGTNGIGTFSVSGLFNVYGNVMSLIYGENYNNQTALKSDYNFAHLLEDCTHLGEAFELVLPSTTLRPHCYDSMFKGCWSMVKIPYLKATTLAEGCYAYMFSGCETITEMCDLPATTLATNCYSHMFEGCKDLFENIYLLAETLVSGCYDTMFSGTSASYVEALFLTEPGTAYTNNWLADVAYYGTFIKNSNSTWVADDHRGPSGIPAYTEGEEPETAYTWNVIGSNYQTRWIDGQTYCDGVQLWQDSIEEYSDDGGQTWHPTGAQEENMIVEHSIQCGFVSGDTEGEYDDKYIGSGNVKNADITFINVDGKPNIKTDANGQITEFTYTDATDDSPVMFNGDSEFDTAYHPFTSGGKNFVMTMKFYVDPNDQVYKAGADDNMVNVFTARGEGTYNYGFSFRISKAQKYLVLNGNFSGGGFGNKKITDDGTHMYYFEARYENGTFSVKNLKTNTYIYNPTAISFGSSDTMDVVLAAAVDSSGNYYRICKCKYFHFDMRTL